MRSSRLGWFLAIPLLASVAPIGAQEADPLKAEFSGSFSQTPLSAVIAVVHSATRLNVVLGPEVEENLGVTANVSRMPLANFLTEVERQTRLTHTMWCGALVLHAAGKAPGPEPRLPAGEALDARVSVAFEGTPFLFAIERLRVRTAGVELEVTARARASVQSRGASLWLRVHRLPAKCLFAHLARAAGLTLTFAGGKATFDDPDAAGRTVDAGTLEVQGDEPLETQPVVDPLRLLAELKTAGGREGARRQLIAGGKPVAAAVATFLGEKDLDPPTLCAALQVLAQVGEAAQAEPVLAIFRDASRPLDVRTEAGVTLGALAPAGAVGALIDALDDPWFRIAETARAALVEIGEPAVEPLVTRWQAASARPSGSDGLVYRGLLIFGSIGTERCKQLLLDALKHNSGPRALPLRHHAAIGLGFTQDPKMIEPMIEALERERQFLVASYIARSLTWITDEELPPQPARWRAWWAANKTKILAPKSDELYDPIELPTDESGFPLLDPPADPQQPRR